VVAVLTDPIQSERIELDFFSVRLYASVTPQVKYTEAQLFGLEKIE